MGKSTGVAIDDAGDCSICLSISFFDHITNRAFSTLLEKKNQRGLLVINKAVWKQRDLLEKNQRHWLAWPSSHPVCWNQIREYGACRKGCSAIGLLNLTDIPPTGTHWFHLQMGKIQTFPHLSVASLMPYIWKNSWRDRWVKGRMIYNPRIVFGEKISSYFSNPLSCPPWMMAFTSSFIYMSWRK